MSFRDSDVQVVDDSEARHEDPRDRRPCRSPEASSYCFEKNGVQQSKPYSAPASKHLSSVSSRPSSNEITAKPLARTQKERKVSNCHKRLRVGHSSKSVQHQDSFELKKSMQQQQSKQNPAIPENYPQEQRQSPRLRERSRSNEYNPAQLHQDRKKRQGKDSNSLGYDGRDDTKMPLSEDYCIDLLDDGDSIGGKKPFLIRPSCDEKSEKKGQLVSPERSAHPEEAVPASKGKKLKEGSETPRLETPYIGPTHLIFEFPPGERGKIRVTEEERGRLIQRKYLNDSLIDFYIKYIESNVHLRDKRLHFSIKTFSSFFFGRLRRREPIDYEGVKGWTKNVDIFTKRFVFVPICDSYHWSIIIVANLDQLESYIDCGEECLYSNRDAPKIIYLDSLDPKRGGEFGEVMRHYLVEEWLSKRIQCEKASATRKATSAGFKRVIQIVRPNVPIQTNEYDCGLYLLNSLEMFLQNTDGLQDKLLAGVRDVRDVYSHVDITMLRKEIINLMDALEGQQKFALISRGASHEDISQRGEDLMREEEKPTPSRFADSAAGAREDVDGRWDQQDEVPSDRMVPQAEFEDTNHLKTGPSHQRQCQTEENVAFIEATGLAPSKHGSSKREGEHGTEILLRSHLRANKDESQSPNSLNHANNDQENVHAERAPLRVEDSDEKHSYAQTSPLEPRGESYNVSIELEKPTNPVVKNAQCEQLRRIDATDACVAVPEDDPSAPHSLQSSADNVMPSNQLRDVPGDQGGHSGIDDDRINSSALHSERRDLERRQGPMMREPSAFRYVSQSLCRPETPSDLRFQGPEVACHAPADQGWHLACTQSQESLSFSTSGFVCRDSQHLKRSFQRATGSQTLTVPDIREHRDAGNDNMDIDEENRDLDVHMLERTEGIGPASGGSD